jgi:phosphohistidine phosphatase SixA
MAKIVRQTGWGILAAVWVALMMAMPGTSLAAGEAALWQALKDGKAFAILRHALAPGTGDPARFAVDDCATQRNLSEQGRAQARRIGELFRKNGISSGAVYSSQWCRCRDTAREMNIGTVQDLPALNSFFGAMGRRTRQTDQLRDWLAAYKGMRPLVMISHQVNISALVNVATSSGEIVFARQEGDGTIVFLGAIETR